MNYQTTYLKGCPFCGQRPEIGVTLILDWGHYTVRCVNDECAVTSHVTGSTFANAEEKWNNRAEEPKNTKFITQINHTDVEVVDTAEGYRRIYRFEGGSWWLIDSSCKPYVAHGGTK